MPSISQCYHYKYGGYFRTRTAYARVLQAKYYSNDNILDAQQTEGIPYAWQSLLRGVKLIRDDYICPIGDGALVNMERSLDTTGWCLGHVRSEIERVIIFLKMSLI
jgi:hypothetical protein